MYGVIFIILLPPVPSNCPSISRKVFRMLAGNHTRSRLMDACRSGLRHPLFTPYAGFNLLRSGGKQISDSWQRKALRSRNQQQDIGYLAYHIEWENGVGIVALVIYLYYLQPGWPTLTTQQSSSAPHSITFFFFCFFFFGSSMGHYMHMKGAKLQFRVWCSMYVFGWWLTVAVDAPAIEFSYLPF